MEKLQFDYLNVELGIPSFLVKARFQPRGDLTVFINNLTYLSFYFEDVEMLPLSAQFQLKGFKQPAMTINRGAINFISLLDEADVKKMQILAAKRTIVCYTEWFAIRGDLHVNTEAPNENLFDDKYEFFILTDATIFPLQKMMVKPVQKVPALILNRKPLLGYHIHQE
ncbi:MAG: hypothetical protein M5U34_29520 [Chloroflexi bacterium]|nr:hypothetical protein [Chloroflexota bacterium]